MSNPIPAPLEELIEDLTQRAGNLGRTRLINVIGARSRSNRMDHILDDLDLLLPKALEDRPLSEFWDYWINRLKLDGYEVLTHPYLEPLIVPPGRFGSEVIEELEAEGIPGPWELARTEDPPEDKTILDLKAKISYMGLMVIGDIAPTASGLTYAEVEQMSSGKPGLFRFFPPESLL